MTPRIQSLLKHILEKQHAALRHDANWTLAQKFSRDNTPPEQRAVAALCAVLAAEVPAFLPGERIAFIRTVKQLPDLYTPSEMETLRMHAYYHERGCIFNITPDYATTICSGLDTRRAELESRLARARNEQDQSATEFLTCAIHCVDAVLDLSDRYRAAAQAQG
ncbi:MAG: pyruvate formate-lyase, partial [Kiritimatiellae bacterium]|nr:pyruvate formate-lyase [Kiritimatiellia bacterium]